MQDRSTSRTGSNSSEMILNNSPRTLYPYVNREKSCILIRTQIAYMADVSDTPVTLRATTTLPAPRNGTHPMNMSSSRSPWCGRKSQSLIQHHALSVPCPRTSRRLLSVTLSDAIINNRLCGNVIRIIKLPSTPRVPLLIEDKSKSMKPLSRTLTHMARRRGV